MQEKNQASQENQISLCMIVKDEEKNLRRCLNSIKSEVDEIVIVDTGSSDNTRQIAKEFTNKVYDFQWSNDFSKARNFSLSKASMQWILFIDADEFLSKNDSGKIRALLNSNEIRKDCPDAFTFDIRTYTNETGVAGWTSSKGDSYPESQIAEGFWTASAVRLFRNKKGYFFEGRIHESPRIPIENAGGKISDSGIIIHHLGALNEKEHFKSKKENYIGLLKQRLAEKDFSKRPEHLICRELASELIQSSRHKEALSYLKRAAEISQSPMDLMNLGATYLFLKDLDNAEKALFKANISKPNQPDICINLGIVYLRKKQYSKAVKRFEKALAANPKSASAYFHLGLVFLRQAKKNKSLQFFQKAIALNPSYGKRIKRILSGM